MTKISLIKTTGDDYWLMFEESDVRKACAISKCGQQMIENCIADMKNGANECTTCYVVLCNVIKAEPVYKKVTES